MQDRPISALDRRQQLQHFVGADQRQLPGRRHPLLPVRPDAMHVVLGDDRVVKLTTSGTSSVSRPMRGHAVAGHQQVYPPALNRCRRAAAPAAACRHGSSRRRYPAAATVRPVLRRLVGSWRSTSALRQRISPATGGRTARPCALSTGTSRCLTLFAAVLKRTDQWTSGSRSSSRASVRWRRRRSQNSESALAQRKRRTIVQLCGRNRRSSMRSASV